MFLAKCPVAEHKGKEIVQAAVAMQVGGCRGECFADAVEIQLAA